MTPTPEEAARRLITNFNRDMRVLLDAIDTEYPYRSKSPFTGDMEPDKLAGMFSEETIDVGKDATKG